MLGDEPVKMVTDSGQRREHTGVNLVVPAQFGREVQRNLPIRVEKLGHLVRIAPDTGLLVRDLGQPVSDLGQLGGQRGAKARVDFPHRPAQVRVHGLLHNQTQRTVSGPLLQPRPGAGHGRWRPAGRSMWR